ncbi:MAG: toll/interleukin-1 receptor domain-containing protein [Desulfobacteraceae bacterium]|nr:toll/interleukin-1 receptor domain-containing protein [Desulfobacteraceae bacterium]
MSLKETIQHLLGTKALKPSDADSAKYHDNFVESGNEKAKYILDDINKRWKHTDLSRCAYFSIGGSTGAEITYIMKNSPIKYGMLLEYDSDATDIARKKQEELSASGKTLKIITGDATQQISRCKDILLRWRDENKITGLIASAQAVLHELPFRSPDFHLGYFIGEIAWDWDPFLFYSREPCAPSDWPDEVEISIPEVESNLLKELTEDIKAKLGMHGNVRTVGIMRVSMPAKLAVETLTKIFYLDSYPHEIEEQVTSTDPASLRTALEKQLGTNSTSLQRLSSDSFEKKYREFGITAENYDGKILPMPLAFAWIVGERRSPDAAGDQPQSKEMISSDDRTGIDDSATSQVNKPEDQKIDKEKTEPGEPATPWKSESIVSSDSPKNLGIKVFICCADEDDKVARRLYNDFKKLGLAPWLASIDIRLGQKPEQKFRSEMKESDYVVALLSKHSLSVRGFAQKQLKMALNILEEYPTNNIFLIPVQLDNTKPHDQELEDLKSTELYKSYEDGFKEIVRAITK